MEKIFFLNPSTLVKMPKRITINKRREGTEQKDRKTSGTPGPLTEAVWGRFAYSREWQQELEGHFDRTDPTSKDGDGLANKLKHKI